MTAENTNPPVAVQNFITQIDPERLEVQMVGQTLAEPTEDGPGWYSMAVVVREKQAEGAE